MANDPSTPQSTKEEGPNLGCSIEDFIAYSRLAWNNCRSRIEAFALQSGRFSLEYVDGRLTLLTTLEAMPTKEQREATVSVARSAFLAEAQKVRDFALSLKSKTETAYVNPTSATNELALSGITAFLAKTTTDWAAYPGFLTKVNAYLTDKLAFLVEKGVAVNALGPQAKALNDDFKLKSDAYIAAEQTAEEGRVAQNNLILELSADGKFMLKTGQEIYKYEPTVLPLFIKAKLLALVRGLKPAGLKGKMTISGSKKPFVGILASTTVAGELRTVLTDDKGDYFLKVPKGDYDFTFSINGQELYVLTNKTIEAGIKSRFSMAFVPPQA